MVQRQSLLWKLGERIFDVLCPEERFCTQLVRESNKTNSTSGDAGVNRHVFPLNEDKLLGIIRQNQLQVVFLEAYPVLQKLSNKVRTLMVTDSLLIKHRVQKRQKEYERIIQLFSDQHIRFVIMKTPFELQRIYDEPVKLNLDLDILVPVAEYERAANLLMHDGYVHKNAERSSLKSGNFYLPSGEEIFYKGNFLIELHTTIVGTSGFETRVLNEKTNRLITDELYKDTVIESYGQSRVRMFAPTSLFFSLFLHLLYQHNFQSVMRFYQVACVLKKNGDSIRWKQVILLVKKYRLYPYFLWYVCFFDDLFPALLPAHIVHSARSYQESWGIDRIFLFLYLKKRLFHPDESPYSDSEKRFIWAIVEHDGRRFVSSRFVNLGTKLTRKRDQ